ncbi:MAG: hypothetical protein P1Q69_00975 [Candidatus Thorarchaeota archaeon]|nr:hypothetical protein [Candidatus Thorarchaeota archaeon]
MSAIPTLVFYDVKRIGRTDNRNTARTRKTGLWLPLALAHSR